MNPYALATLAAISGGSAGWALGWWLHVGLPTRRFKKRWMRAVAKGSPYAHRWLPPDNIEYPTVPIKPDPRIMAKVHCDVCGQDITWFSASTIHAHNSLHTWRQRLRALITMGW